MPLNIATAPTHPAVSLAEMKRHLGVTSSDRDVDIESLTDAASNYIARRCKRTFPETEYLLTLSDYEFPASEFCAIYLPRPPVISVENVEYYATADGSPIEITDYQLVRSEVAAFLLPAAGERWPEISCEKADAFRVEYTAGYVTVPPEAKHAIKLLVRHWYDNASAVQVGGTSKEIELGLASLVRSLGIGFYADDLSPHETRYY